MVRRSGLIRYDAREAAFYRQKLIKRVQADVRECYQCGNCTAGCPAAFTYDYMPNQMMRMLQVGMVDEVLDSKSIQLCIQCLTCTARCPRDIDIAGILEDLKTIAVAQERKVPEHVKTFNKSFMGSVARFGRLPEFVMMALFYTGTMNPKMALGDMSVVMPLVTRRKLQFIPRKAKGAAEVGRIYKKSLAIARKREKAEAEARAETAAEEARAAKAAKAASADETTGADTAASDSKTANDGEAA